MNQHIKLLEYHLKRLSKENPRLAVRTESTWGTAQCQQLLADFLEQLHSDHSQTTYREYHSVLNLWLLHQTEWQLNCTPQYLETETA